MIKPTAIWQRFAYTLDAARPGFALGPWFTMNAVVDIRGPLDVRRLEQAVRDLVARHDLLRTRVEDGMQVIRPHVSVDLETFDDTELLHVPVESSRLSPLRVRLKRVAADQHMLCLHIHHMMADPVTLWVLLDELAALYRGPLPAPPAQFWQYAEDQARLVADGRQAAEAWWGRFTGPFAAPSTTPAGDFAFRQRILDAGEATEVERFSRRHRGTMFVSLLAGFTSAMLPYLGPGESVMVNTLFSRRNRTEWRRLPGPCTVPAYIPLPRPPESLTGEYVAAVRDVVLGAQQHILVDALGPPSPFIEYVPDARPQALRFGEATGAVVDAAGPKDTGQAGDLGIRARRTDSGELFAHLSGDGVGWSKKRVLAVCDALPWRVSLVSEVS
ncbi:condensation domain-containing protein [Kibdelosporangium persicum]|uniref:Plipastatin synthase subunit D n=1 Tax=Kibdelosporangium persicum TaxID=2698649 RepID=A0ABX2F8M1_9PSEU|nr:condensation domain-containing protein [Kibdelosporangium persicum]NRN67705.1 Plipastatin synthase subunit D [Kibdelosporangium persicum]